MTVEDLRGELVAVGDTIAYACHGGMSVGMRIGTVIEIVEAGRRPMKTPHGYVQRYRDAPTMLRVHVEHTNKVDMRRMDTLIQADMRRFVKVTP